MRDVHGEAMESFLAREERDIEIEKRRKQYEELPKISVQELKRLTGTWDVGAGGVDVGDIENYNKSGERRITIAANAVATKDPETLINNVEKELPQMQVPEGVGFVDLALTTEQARKVYNMLKIIFREE